MTKDKFKEWLQAMMRDHRRIIDGDYADILGVIMRGMIHLPKGVLVAVDHVGHDVIFSCEDGLLCSHFSIEPNAGRTVWAFPDGDVNSNIYDYTVNELDDARLRTQEAVERLKKLLPQPSMTPRHGRLEGNYMPYTFEKRYGDHILKLTQKINIHHDFGHYNWCIEDGDGHILYAGYSTGSPDGKVTEADLDKIYSSCFDLEDESLPCTTDPSYHYSEVNEDEDDRIANIGNHRQSG